jgi:hypothetical protein
LRVDRHEKTANFGYPIDQPGAKQSYLHEVGHILGLVHEYQNPAAGPIWNRDAVYAYFGDRMRWTRDTVNRQIFDSVVYPGQRPLDRKSVMSYQLPGTLFRDGRGFAPQDALSESDQTYIGNLYP